MNLQESSQDYQRIAQALAYLRAHYREQPSLREVSERFGLSEAHFQRLFSRWAGISPKRFVQFLTVEFAKANMAGHTPMLDLAAQAGLSGPGRLHDLFVNLEAMSPGEYRRRAAGLRIQWARVPTPFGEATLAFTERGVCHFSFVDNSDPLETLSDLWPQALLMEEPELAYRLVNKIFAETRTEPVSAWVVGTNFQVQVWRALLQIPRGALKNYRQVAEQLGRAGAARSVGTAIARNPIGYLIPCHRVLRQSGDIGEYHWGSERKAAMIAWEAARCLGAEEEDFSKE